MGSVLGSNAIKQLRDDHKKLSRLRVALPAEGASKHKQGNDLRVVLAEALTAPATSDAAPTTCVCALLNLDPVTKLLTVTNYRLTAYNFTTGNTAAKGTYARVKFDGVWEIYWLACSATAAWADTPRDGFSDEIEEP